MASGTHQSLWTPFLIQLITLSWALEHGHIAANTKFAVPDSIRVDSHVAPYRDAEPHIGVPKGIEHWTTADILRESSNVGTIKIANMLGPARFDKYLHAFGFGRLTTLGLPGESSGYLLLPKSDKGTGTIRLRTTDGTTVYQGKVDALHAL